MLTWFVNTWLIDHLLAAFERITGAVLISADDADLRPELTRADGVVRILHRRLRDAERRAHDAEHLAEQAAELIMMRSAEQAAKRIHAAHRMYPDASQRTLAMLAHTAVSYVNQVLNGEDNSERKPNGQQPTPND
jgi:hypothetical protein